MEVIITEDYAEMSEVGAKVIIDEMIEKNDLVIGFATGSTPIGMYQQLIDACEKQTISFRNVISYNLDEYIGLDVDHEQSYNYFMRDNLFDHIDINPKNINMPMGNGEDHDKLVKEYQDKLNQKQIDIQILGIGANGHVGFNEPGTPFDSHVHVVELTEKTREDNKRFFEKLEDVPEYAITMGIADIMAAKKILVLASGKSKAQAVKTLLEGHKSEDFPASILFDHEDVILVVDKEAMSLVED